MKRIVALHGQLGMADDWDSFASIVPENAYALEAVDLWSFLEGGDLTMENFGSRLNDVCLLHKKEGCHDLLLGYSMGGRLALHALIEDARNGRQRWKAAVIVSAHLGLDSDEAKHARRKVDDAWAEKAQVEEWSAFLKAWNKQSVLNGKAGSQMDLPDRMRLERRRAEVARSFRCWSLAEQEFLLSSVREIEVPVLFIVGEEDQKFYEYYQKIGPQLLKQIEDKVTIVSMADLGHRLPWEDEEKFAECVFEWLERLGDLA